MTTPAATARTTPSNPAPTAAAPVVEDRPVSLRLLLLLAFVAAASPLAIDLYLASFPAIQRDLSTTPGLVQLTLTAYLVGISIGQPLWGPLADRFGRRRTLLVSNAITVVSSLVVVLAPTIEVLIAARFGQALAAASGMVIARAMVADLAQGYAGVRALSLMMTVHALLPMLAPGLGGVLATVMSWRGVLGVLAAVVAAQLVVTVLLVPETLPPQRRTPRVDYRDLGRVVRDRAYLAYALTLGFTVATLMVYAGGASFVYQEVMGFSPLTFGLAFTLNASAMLAGGVVSARLARRRVHPVRTVLIALPASVGCCFAALLAACSPVPLLLVGPVFVNGFFINLVTSNCMALAMQRASGRPGAGSAMLGLFMFGVSALVTSAGGLAGSAGSAVAMTALMAATSLAGAATFALNRAEIRSARAERW